MRKQLVIAALLLVLGINIYFRLYPAYFPQLKHLANENIEIKIIQDIASKVNQKHPGLEDLSKTELVKRQIRQFKALNKKQINKDISEEYRRLKNPYQDEQGQTYLLELDCWHWARYVENILRSGNVGDEIRGQDEIDNLMFAPQGWPVPRNKLIFYLSAFLYRLFCLFKPVPLFTFLFYLPLFFLTVFIVALYFYCLRNWGLLAAIVSCLFVGLAPVFLSRSTVGWFDTDILNLLFPLAITWAYLNAYKGVSQRKGIFWVLFSGFLTGLFAFTWANWWFIFLIVLIYEGYSQLNLLSRLIQFKQREGELFKRHFYNLLGYLGFSLFCGVVFLGANVFDFIPQVKEALILNKPYLAGMVWPNVYSTVSELRQGNYRQIAYSVGGLAVFVAAFGCLGFLTLRRLFNPEFSGFKNETANFFSLWALIMFLACFRGSRFAMFLLIPLGVSLGWVVNEAYFYFKRRAVVLFAAWGLIFLLALKLITNANDTAKTIYPLINDSWYNLLNSLKQDTPKDAVINSWWDFGDWFKVIARRRVIFDGQTQNTPQAYWMARVLISDNEEESFRILRMLNNGGNQAFEIIDKQLKDSFKSALLLKKIILLDKEEAKKVLSKLMPSPAVEQVLGLLFNQPKIAYFLVDSSMPDKIPAISFLGNWDFVKPHSPNSRMTRQKGFYGDFSQSQNIDGNIFFDGGLVYNSKTDNMQFYEGGSNQYKTPRGVVIFENGVLRKVEYPYGDLNFSVLLTRDGPNNRAILLDQELINSLFVKLYYLNGAGLRHFKLLKAVENEDAVIKVFKIEWE